MLYTYFYKQIFYSSNGVLYTYIILPSKLIIHCRSGLIVLRVNVSTAKPFSLFRKVFSTESGYVGVAKYPIPGI